MFAEIDPTYAAYEEGRCDAVTSDRSQLVARRTALPTRATTSSSTWSCPRSHSARSCRSGDDQWFNVVKWMVFATIEAEELGITQANVAEQRGERRTRWSSDSSA